MHDMTDFIFQREDGHTTHYYIDDGVNGAVFVRKGGSITTKREDPAVEQMMIQGLLTRKG